MKSFLIALVAGLIIGAVVTFGIAHIGTHRVHVYTTSPEMSATGGLMPLSPEAAKAVLAPKPAAGAAPAPAPAPVQTPRPQGVAPSQQSPTPAQPGARPQGAAPATPAAPAASAPAQTQTAAVPAPRAPAPAAPGGGNAEAGGKAFNKCKACHTTEANGADRVGPNLHGMFGRKSGGKPGYKYSDAMVKAAVTWDDATIAKYMADPKGFIPGNRMAFPGIAKEQERADIIAFLKTATK